MTDYVLTGLVKRRAELTGDIERIHLQLRNAVDDLENLSRLPWLQARMVISGHC
jgi:predicted lipid carrier protein YhbT